MNMAGKRLLMLGGTVSTYDFVKMAQEMGVYTIVTDNNPEPGPAKQIADEIAMVSTDDIDGLVQLCKEKKVDAVFTGASEFNLRNCIRVSEKAGLRFYTDMQTWNNCANKETFKKFCQQFGIDTPERFEITEDSSDEALAALPYPVIVKPVDSSSSIGITVCYEASQMRQACRFAREHSVTDTIIVEKFIENDRLVTAFSYVVKEGEPHLVATYDDYMVMQSKNPFNHINSTPSKYVDYYLEHVNEKAIKMLKAMGVKNGSLFFQTLPYEGKIYFMEMGFRISGGSMHKVSEPATGINATRGVMRYVLGDEVCADELLEKVNPQHPFCSGGQFCIPLNAGTIARYEGLEESKQVPGVTDVVQYYYPGDTVEERVLGTLGQQCLRYTAIANSLEEYVDIARRVFNMVKVYDTEGNLMNTMDMDFERFKL